VKPPRREAWRCFVLAPALLMMGCAAFQPSNPLAMDCGDLAVIGRVETVREQPEPPPADWQSRYDVQIHIRKVVRGTESRTVVPASAIAHAHLRDDIDFLMVLTPEPGGGFSIKSAQINSLKPGLKSRCEG